MELSDRMFVMNHDWDPQYLRDIVSQDFYEFRDLWQSNISDCDLVREANDAERYSPIIEDISMDDDTLCQAVEHIESQ